MKNKFLFCFALLSILVFSSESVLNAQSVKFKKRPVNVILFIGDGMGPAQVSAGIVRSDNTYVLKLFKYAGYCTTSSFDHYVTDSAAAGTAIACGVKTRNGMLGMGPDSVAVASIMEVAKKNGLSTGLVSTSAITHATPASFIAKNSGRGNYEDIALDFMNGKIDVFIGGGSDHFNKRKDGKDLTAQLRANGYDVVYTLDELKKSNSLRIAGLLDTVHMAKSTEGRFGMLAEMTAKAIETLSKNKKGFVLMVEGSQIDFAGHERNLEWNVSEVLDLNVAISVAYDFAEETRNTLVVVTADHETGGLALVGGDLKKKSLNGVYATGNHTAVMVPVFSYGPGAEKFTGIIDNTDFFPSFRELLRLK
ncbi:MAG TPA: alkaline phosphatase [Bacteroidales bacterium]|nr:alkaline phosphatase [Bacteroidales bacterium]HOU95090.1 alkaline phosphatase [Bacteroidales bacterium]HQG36420.1 alkaline phosphatase [Bacteroidales bacterium]HQG53674.1 alkaline phosphatase [Bacteroidales bacterium]HQJ20510.1 alkaline phosphatase [Bacteroidales bacterium]